MNVKCVVKVIIRTACHDSENELTFLLYSIETECESCGENERLWCSVCQQTRCDVCDNQWHKHPSRRDHNQEVHSN